MSVLVVFVGIFVALGGSVVPQKRLTKLVVVMVGAVLIILGFIFREWLEAFQQSFNTEGG